MKRIGFAAGLAALGMAALLTVGCEDTGITAPEGSTITLIASPAAISINQDAGETQGTTAIVAQLLSGGLPQQDIPIFFSSTGGILASVVNVCAPGGTCTRSSDTCIVDTDCPFVPPASIETDQNGIATDVLTLRLIEDPASVSVTAQSTASLTTIEVTTNVNLGPIDPVAVITDEPTGGARTGSPINFSGSDSTFDPLVNITCYEWTINSNLTPSEIERTTSPSIDRTYGEPYSTLGEQDLTVTLRVSDETGYVCDNSSPPPPFSAFEDTITYQIRCDFTDPSVDAGSDITRSLTTDADNEGNVLVSLSATAFDEEDSDLTYEWNCGTASQPTPPDGQAVSCSYDTEGTFTATVTVTNRCGRFQQDSLTVRINT